MVAYDLWKRTNEISTSATMVSEFSYLDAKIKKQRPEKNAMNLSETHNNFHYVPTICVACVCAQRA